ncbi:MAG: hypothetical protein EGR36_10340 [Eubacterium ventriosum]|nr:hypothetical protein [Eubacterium ventriosum]
MLHLIIFWFVIELIFNLITKKKSFKRYYAGIITMVFTFVYLCVGWYQAHHIWQKDYTIKTDKKVSNIKVALLSDSYVGTTFHGEGFAERMKEIEKQNSDVILVAGDFVDEDTTKEDMISCCKTLGSAKTKYGVYYVFGNHDKGYYPDSYRGYGEADLVKKLKDNNVKVLQDENVLIDNRFCIIGRQDRSEEVEKNKGRATMSELTSSLDDSKFSIVMNNQPYDYANQAKSGVDLVVSGHTHGGQLFPLMNIENLTGLGDDRVYGYEKRDNTNFIVTSGISDWEIKFKTGCKSEYVIVNIQGK